MVRVKSPLVSVLIPAYNEEVYIERCLVSLLEQSYPSIEILLTDDGSSDKTLAIVKGLAKRHKSIRVFTQLHQGPEEAWRKMSLAAKGNIFMMFGADMTAGPSLVEDLVRPLINGEAQGTSPRVEIIKNAAWSWWARARGKVRVTNPQAILVTTRKVWEKYWSTDKRAGYTSDQTIFFNSGIKPLMVDTFLYHNNPASLHECWRQFLWIGGASKRKWLFVVAFFLFPVAAVGKSVVQFVQDPFLPFIFFLPFYHSVKYVGYGLGVFRRWFTGKNIK
ncbi:MAG TPA: glycosyltransferase family 2 protein [Candidatus Nanoarchaeia archaeon]|nr:glycosyltransferase family 2 protein [Candidatus Nanoarchaeia archaeon]